MKHRFFYAEDSHPIVVRPTFASREKLKTSISAHDGSRVSNSRIQDSVSHQKRQHRHISRAFKQLTSELHRVDHETPFQAHLARYHQHRH